MMESRIMVVRFPDGTIKYGIFDEDYGHPGLFNTPEEAWDWWDEYSIGDASQLPLTDESVVMVEVCNGVCTWKGRATVSLFLGPPEPYELSDSLLDEISGFWRVPEWAAEVLV